MIFPYNCEICGGGYYQCNVSGYHGNDCLGGKGCSSPDVILIIEEKGARIYLDGALLYDNAGFVHVIGHNADKVSSSEFKWRFKNLCDDEKIIYVDGIICKQCGIDTNVDGFTLSKYNQNMINLEINKYQTYLEKKFTKFLIQKINDYLIQKLPRCKEGYVNCLICNKLHTYEKQ